MSETDTAGPTSGPLEFGILGLGRIGGGLAHQALDKGMRVAGSSRSGVDAAFTDKGMMDVGSPEGFAGILQRPRAIFLWVPAGTTVDALIDKIAPTLDEGDVIVDGGNSYWGDSRRRGAALAERGLEFVDLGTSGGLPGARAGACFMAGGSERAYARIAPILDALAVPGGTVHAGPPGSGHFVKLVHNGIEFGMLQAIGEGLDLLEHHDRDLPIADVLRCWSNGSVIRSWLVELLEQAYREDGGLERVPSHVEDTGEVNWLVADALQMERPTPVIAQAVQQLLISRDGDAHAARAVAAMRRGFGGHPYGPDESVAAERRGSRLGPMPDPGASGGDAT
jgi:6-phosphogluconate dehydrogenase